jgi:hypothetical protein
VPLDESEPGDEGLRAVAEALRAVLLDAYVDEAERLEALRAYRHLKDKKFGSTLQTLADQSELEGTSLLSTVEREVRRHRIRLEPPPAAGKTTLVKEDKEE